MNSGSTVRVRVIHGDALHTDADVLALKYARQFYGADERAADTLKQYEVKDMSPGVGSFRLLDTQGAVAAHRVLFVGVPQLYQFDYSEIRIFGSKVLAALAGEVPDARVIVMTLHGPGYGLDERECFLSELAGLADAVASGDYPSALSVIKIVEQNRGRAQRLSGLLEVFFPGGWIDSDLDAMQERIGSERSKTLRDVGYESSQKSHVFVAMPFSDDMSDLFYYGIRQAVNANGYLCERIDLTPSVGDVLTQIKNKIKTSSFVVAELTGANPNVYLEVGYAWACEVPTILLIKKEEISCLRFDVAGQRCIMYSSIRDLEERLSSELSELKSRQLV